MLVVDQVSKSYSTGFFKPSVPAVKQVSFTVNKGEAFGMMGANGSGKSTVAHLIMKLTKADSGRILFQEKDLLDCTKKDLRWFRRKIQIIFQQPLQALDPKQTIRSAIMEPLRVHGLVRSKKEGDEKIKELLDLTNLSGEILNRFPQQISGGQAQRVVIARALSLNPELIIADEPTSMLDISSQAQILALLKKLQVEFGIGIILISHDLSVIRRFCDRLVVMKEGNIVHQGDTCCAPN